MASPSFCVTMRTRRISTALGNPMKTNGPKPIAIREGETSQSHALYFIRPVAMAATAVIAVLSQSMMVDMVFEMQMKDTSLVRALGDGDTATSLRDEQIVKSTGR